MLPILTYPDPEHPGRLVTLNRLRKIQNKQKSKNYEAFDKGLTEGELIETKTKAVIQALKTETPTISPTRQKAMDDLAKIKAGIPFTRSYPQTEIREPEPEPTMSFEERLIHDWKNDSALQREFTSFNSYASFMKAQGEGRAKIHRGCVVK